MRRMAKLAALAALLLAIFGTVTMAKTGDVVIEYPSAAPVAAVPTPAVTEDAVAARLTNAMTREAAALGAFANGDISRESLADYERLLEPAVRSIEWDAGNLYARRATGSTFWLMLAAREYTNSLFCFRRGIEMHDVFLRDLAGSYLKSARADMDLRRQERARELGS
jgi:hypothetical protein